LLVKKIRILDPNFYFQGFGFDVNPNFVEITGVNLFPGIYRVDLKLAGPLTTLGGGGNQQFDWNTLLQNGVYLEILSENVVVPTNYTDTTTIPSEYDLIYLNNFVQRTNKLEFSGNTIGIPKTVYASTTIEPDSPTATILTTVSSAGTTTTTETYGSTTNTDLWFDGVAPDYPISTNYFAVYVQYIPNWFGTGIGLMSFENQNDPGVTAMLQAIVDNDGGKIAIKHYNNFSSTITLQTYELDSSQYGPPNVNGTVALKIFGDIDNSGQSFSDWGFASDNGVLKLEKTTTLIATPISMVGLSSIIASPLAQTAPTTFFFGVSNIAVPATVLTGTASGLVLSPDNFNLYFPSGITTGSEIKYFTKTTSIPTASQITYKETLEAPIKLYSRENKIASISVNDKYGKITIGDDDYITIKYDTLLQPELISTLPINEAKAANAMFYKNNDYWILNPDYLKPIFNDNSCIIDSAELYFERNYIEIATTKGSSIGVIPLTGPGTPNTWTWNMPSAIIKSSQEVQIQSATIYLRWATDDITQEQYLAIGSQSFGNNDNISSQPVFEGGTVPQRIILTLKFRQLL
jgi:hypothetical protein